jgi:tetratricopeptide (TPR) repeat protein
MPNRIRNAGTWLAIVCASIAAYLPALSGSLLWDDSSHVTGPGLQSLHGLWRIWFDLGATQQYYPLLHSAFWLEHRIWADAVLGYHLTNVALHALAACLLVMVARRLSLPGASLAGLIFALHPLCVEAVAWISEQKSVLSGVFYLAAALAYLGFDDSRRLSRYFAALGLFVLALLSKTVTATLPAALLVVFWWRRGRLEWKRDVRPLLPWFVLAAAAGLFTAWVERTSIGARGPDFALDPVQRILLAGRAIWFYAGKLIWPANLTFIYPRWNLDAGEWWQYLFPAGVLAAAAGLWRIARRRHGPLAGFLFFAGTLFPVLGFFNVYPFRYSYVADHFAYLAVLGILVPVASVLADDRLNKPARFVLTAAVLAALGVSTWRQSGIYRDEETLYRVTLERNPGSWLAHNNLGNILLKIPGRRDDAKAHFEAALRAKPDYWEAHLSLGNALVEIPGRLDDAIGEYRTALRVAPDSERTHANLGNALLQAGRTEEAIVHLETALRIDPGNAVAHNDLGNAMLRIPARLPEALAEYQAAIRSDPNLAEAHNNLGRLYAQAGRLPDAVAEFAMAIRIRPDYFGAHSNLGNALSEIPGRLPDAVAEYQEALRIRPDFAPAHNNLGNALSQIPGRLPDAIAEYQAAVGQAPDFADAHYNLGRALLRAGRPAEALAEYVAALRIKPSVELREMVERLRLSVESRAGLPQGASVTEGHLGVARGFAEVPRNYPRR